MRTLIHYFPNVNNNDICIGEKIYLNILYIDMSKCMNYLLCFKWIVILSIIIFIGKISLAEEKGIKKEDDSKKNVLDAIVNVEENVKNGNITMSNLTKSDSVVKSEVINNEAMERRDSLLIFFILSIIAAATLLVHILIVTECRFIPESLCVVLLGAFVGLCLSFSKYDWSEVESFNPNFFFLVLLPPIIFESGYNLHKGNFFANILPILTYAIFGTAISALVMGISLWFLGKVYLSYNLTAVEAFAFSSMISAVDPVATLAIFQALKVDVQLYMLVFGESMLNDAVSIALTSTTLEMSGSEFADYSIFGILWYAVTRFFYMFLVSAFLGFLIGLFSALLFKHVDLRRTPSLEFALLLIFSYLPYGLAEALSLSGIISILFSSITMSQYTHYNISPISELTLQQTFRTISFVSETCTFVYLGMALFTFHLEFRPMFIFWSLILLFASRACNIFPLSYLLNKFRKPKISLRSQIIMWFSSMRGAVAFALALHMDLESNETKRVILTNTLFLILFTITFLGGTALPMINFLNNYLPSDSGYTSMKENSGRLLKKRRSRKERNSRSGGSKKRKSSPVILSKTQEMTNFDNNPDYFTEQEEGDLFKRRGRGNIFSHFNNNIMKKLFVRKFTLQEKIENKEKFRNLASEAMKSLAEGSEESEDSGGSRCLFNSDEGLHGSQSSLQQQQHIV
uniref:Sodium/hydrogen exchanger n=1 Tax=Strongyloides stercoralis TaxID=6248 RepID=A0A0K0DS88_STRER